MNSLNLLKPILLKLKRNFYFNRKQGFTLIELLVVIAIIGLLASVTLGSLNNARQNAVNLVINTNVMEHAKALFLTRLETNDPYPETSLYLACSGDHPDDRCGTNNIFPEDANLNSYLGSRISKLPLLTTVETPGGTFEGPLYQCVDPDGPGPLPCGHDQFILRWYLKGADADCPSSVIPPVTFGDATACAFLSDF